MTYNGRGFDWPLLVARYRMARRPRRPTRAISTCCRSSAGSSATGWPTRGWRRSRRSCSASTGTRTSTAGEIPGRYLDYLRGGLASRSSTSSATTTRTSARSRGCSSTSTAATPTASRWREAPRATSPGSRGRSPARAGTTMRWAAWTPRRAAAGIARQRTMRTGGCRSGRSTTAAGRRASQPPSGRRGSIRPGPQDRILVERARLLRRLGRFADAAAVWEAIGAGAGPLSAHAWIQVAKLREHRLRDLPGAFAASE